MQQLEQQPFNSLEQLKHNEEAVVLHVSAPDQCACRLRAMGLCEGANICILHHCDPVIIRCDETRLAICRSLMKHISVSKCMHTVMP